MAKYGNLKANNLIYNLDDGAGDISVPLTSVAGKASLTSPDFVTDITLTAAAPVKFNQTDNTAAVSLKAPGTGVTSYTITLPPVVGASDKVLKTSDGSGTLTWGDSVPFDSPVFTGSPTVPGYLQLLPAGEGGQTIKGDLQLDNAKKFILSETDANGTHYLSFKAPDSVTATVDFTLPDGDGTNGQLLQTNGSGVLSWSTTDLSSYATKADPTFTGTVTTASVSIDGQYKQAFDAVTAAATPAIDCSLGNYFTLDASSTYPTGWSFTNVPASVVYSCIIKVTTGASTTINWNSVAVNGGGASNKIKWNGSAAPTFTQTKPLYIILTTDDTGATWQGTSLVDFAVV